MSDKMNINPAILSWIQTRCAKSDADCHRYFGEKKFKGWKSGVVQPTYAELQRIGEFFRKPIAVFFFSEIPIYQDTRKTFKTLPDSASIFREDFIALIDWARIMQLNLYELHEGINPSSNLITRSSFDLSHTNKLASQLRSTLGLSLEEQKQFASPELAFKRFQEAFYHAGVFVFKGIFKNNNIAGVSLTDEVFPVICINDSLSYTRQIFTLIHELCHLLHGTSGVDFLSLPKDLSLKENKIEAKCAALACAFLAPELKFLVDTLEIPIDCENIKTIS
ncbi:MAG: ImmA/IrrE family metallo-endopeptidase [Deltaproteobacteria bacterium]|jgi:hypothetical protein|nr:ImmA/IrrE family metallo-endopeptidase [Deltaproteobacteria bacterium]